MALRRYALAGYAIWAALLIALYYGISASRIVTWSLLSISSPIAILAGIKLNRPARTLPWLLLAAAFASFAAGQISFLILRRLQMTVPFPSFADVLYLLTFPLYAAALLIFIHWRSPARDRRSLIDALTLTAGLALLSWTYLIHPYVRNPALTDLQKVVAIAYPLGDVLVLALLARLIAAGSGRSRCVQLLILGTIGGLAADTAFGAVTLYGTFTIGTAIDLGWAAYYTGWGAAALHPTMTQLTEPASRQQAEISPARLAVLMLASLIAPVMLLATAASLTTADVQVIAVFSAVLYLLVLTRLRDVATSHARALTRERVLRETGLSLVTAANLDQVAGVMEEAVTTLLNGEHRDHMLFAVRGEDGLHASNGGTRSPPAPRLGELAESLMGHVRGADPVLMSTQRLPGETRAKLPRGDWMLLCPLTRQDSQSNADLMGLITVFGEYRILADLSATVQILASQAALTARSIALRREVTHRESEAYFRAVVQDASDAIVITEDTGRIKYATPSTAVLIGDDTTPIKGEYAWDLVAEKDRVAVARTFADLRESARLGPRYVDQQFTRLDGRRVHVRVRCSDLRDDPTVAGLVFTMRDVTEQRQLEDELKHRAFHDALTGLPNRVLFQDRISQQIASARRTGLISGVLFVDVDDFKLVNDTMGHSVGDELLVAVGARIAALIRESDTAARLSGDEFAVLISNMEGTATVEAAAERVVRAFAEPFALEAGLVTATVSVGVATSMDSLDTDELLRHADLALYSAKAAGKRQWRRYQPVLSAGVHRRRELQEALEEAVAKSAFTLVYQPIFELGSGVLVGFEALVRWPHAQWGMMRPDQFIGLAEETGQIVPLGTWVVHRATADLAQWRRAVPEPTAAAEAGKRDSASRRDLYVSVNVSARQFSDPGFANSVRHALHDSGLEPRALMLELTESALLRRDERQRSDLMELKGIGVRLAIDDFGTGYSSLSYLRELPIDVVKMDKSFVDGIADTPQRLALAEGIVQLAGTLQLEVIAEGIETEIQRELLTSMGCPFGQGYLLAMAMSPGHAEELIREGAARDQFPPARRG